MKFKFDKSNARSAFALGDLERLAMEELWSGGEMSGTQLYEKLGKKLGIQHNTLLTVLERLVKKGLIAKRKAGKFSIYRPILKRDEFAARVAGPLLNELLEFSSYSAMVSFVQQASTDPAKLSQLKKLIEDAEKGNKSNKSKKSKVKQYE